MAPIVVSRTDSPSQTPASISRSTILLIWLSAAMWSSASLARLTTWINFDSLASEMPTGLVAMEVAIALNCVLGLVASVMLVQRRQLSAYFLTGVFLIGVVSHVALWAQSPVTTLPYGYWALGATNIAFVWSLRVRQLLR